MYIKVIKKVCLLVLVFCISLCTFACQKKLDYDSKRLINNLYLANDSMFSIGTAKDIVVPTKTNQIVDNISADSYFIASLNSSKSKYTKYCDPYKKMPMASLTKLMTALVVLKNCEDLNAEYYVSPDAVDLEKDVSVANLKSGDKIKIIDLLYGLLIPSGNDAALCLAENVSSSYDNFIIMMNNEAERIGALNTHFANPHGLDEEYHYTTAYDLFLITRELSKYDLFGKISNTKEYSANILQSDGTMRTEKWVNTNYFVTEELMLSNNTNLIGGKTGNTKIAGSCLVLLVEEKASANRFISVVLNAKSKRNSYYNSNSLLSAISK